MPAARDGAWRCSSAQPVTLTCLEYLMELAFKVAAGKRKCAEILAEFK